MNYRVILPQFAKCWRRNPIEPVFLRVDAGRNKVYDKKVGYARRIIPRSRWGAFEVVGRFGYVDLDDAMVKGGKLAKWYAGANWWASRQRKIGAGYGLADLDKFDATGRTQMFITRLQWIY